MIDELAVRQRRQARTELDEGVTEQPDPFHVTAWTGPSEEAVR